MHGHLGPYDFAIPRRGVGDMVAEMDRIGVAKLFVSHTQCMTAGVEIGNREVADAARAYPQRLLGYLSVWPSAAAEVEAATRRWLAHGLRGLKVHDNNGFSYADPAYAPAYRLMDAYGLPMLFHTWGLQHQLEAVRDVAKSHPGATVLLAHAGCQNIDAYVAAANECPNLYLDLTLSASPRGLIERFVTEAGSHRVVWGSDSCFLSMSQQLGKVIGADISDDDKRRILADNARDILERMREPNGQA
jgi:predicted TIM-barrel fold metal-dependent hydrolase